MKHSFHFLLFLLLSNQITAQVSLGAERVQKLKKSVVRILIDGQSNGTGFFTGKDGQVATCWHVIEPALLKDSANKFLGLKKLEIELNDSTKYEYGIFKYYLNAGNRDAVAFDYCLLGSIKGKPKEFEYFNLGRFSEVNEGDAIYTCGYPLGIKQKFISTGILSSKWKGFNHFTSAGKPDSMLREVAWLDLTMNKGNSGGPVIILGNNPEEDRVIGIASFIITPFGSQLDTLATIASKMKQFGDFGMAMSQNGESYSLGQAESFELIARSLSANSVGISACTSIDYLRKTIPEK